MAGFLWIGWQKSVEYTDVHKKYFKDCFYLARGRDFERLPSSYGKPDMMPIEGMWPVDQEVTVIELRVVDITNRSEIFIDDLVIR